MTISIYQQRTGKAKLQYKEFINDVFTRCQEDFLHFYMVNNHLDQFFGKFLNSLDKYKQWKVMQIFFLVPNTIALKKLLYCIKVSTLSKKQYPSI